MANELLQFGLTLVAIFLPLMLGYVIVHVQESRKRRRRGRRASPD